MRRKSSDARCAERVLRGVDDTGRDESVVIWVERKRAASGRSAGRSTRSTGAATSPGGTTISSRGTSSSDALEAANGALEDDVRVLEDDGSTESVKPFTRKEVLPVLERFFFGAAEAWPRGPGGRHPGSCRPSRRLSRHAALRSPALPYCPIAAAHR